MKFFTFGHAGADQAPGGRGNVGGMMGGCGIGCRAERHDRVSRPLPIVPEPPLLRHARAVLLAAAAGVAAGCGNGGDTVATAAADASSGGAWVGAAGSPAGGAAGAGTGNAPPAPLPSSTPAAAKPSGAQSKPDPAASLLVSSSKEDAALKTMAADMLLPSDTVESPPDDSGAARRVTKGGGVPTAVDGAGETAAAALPPSTEGPSEAAARRAVVVMGADPRGAATPADWQPADPRFKSDAYWNTMVAGFSVRVGAGNAATNTGVEIRNVTAWWLSRSTGRWAFLGASADASLLERGAKDPTTTRMPDAATLPGVSVTVRPQRGWTIEGSWTSGRVPIAAADIAEIVVSVDARLVPLDPAAADDRAAARYLMRAAAEYWPQADTTIEQFAPMSTNPGAGHGRYKRVTADWQRFFFATVAVKELPGNPPPVNAPF